ncbi:MAG TPA: outer membrane beta-barrel protein [Polyangiaceae bacterium]|nr:outer membrane beta-barrel protein [Polyangiaceae bacterium]
MKKAPFLFGLTLTTALAVPALADIPESPTAGHASAAVLLGYGFHDGVGFGVGARGGYTLPMNVYVGGMLTYFTGKDNVSGFLIGPEGGYDFSVGPVVLRPYLGFGPDFLSYSASACAAAFGCVSASASDTKFAFWLGGAALYPITPNWFVGGDMRVMIISDFTNFQLFATGGYQF